MHNVSNPEAEFGASKDPFEQYLLAEVLVATHRQQAAAKYYLAAARGGPYPQGYKYAIDIYYDQGRFDLVDAPLEELAHQRHNPMADWAAYMRFKIARTRWERSGMKDPKLNDQWIERAKDYVDHFPRGRYAYEPRFRLAELLQHDGKYSEAARQYDQVKGDPFYEYAGTFKAAECRYLELAAAANHQAGKPGAMPANEKNDSDRGRNRGACGARLQTDRRSKSARPPNGSSCIRLAAGQPTCWSRCSKLSRKRTTWKSPDCSTGSTPTIRG